MSIKKLQTLPDSRTSRIVTHLENNSVHLEQDISNYAKGRQRYWLNYKWDLANRHFSHGVKDTRLWNFCKEIFPKADLGLVVYGGVGIDLHRDDSYADWRGVGINLGEIEAWVYDCQYPNFHWTPTTNESNPKRYKMNPGDVFQFNTKNPHSALNPAEDRWAIFLWHVNRKFRNKFEAFVK